MLFLGVRDYTRPLLSLGRAFVNHVENDRLCFTWLELIANSKVAGPCKRVMFLKEPEIVSGSKYSSQTLAKKYSYLYFYNT